MNHTYTPSQQDVIQKASPYWKPALALAGATLGLWMGRKSTLFSLVGCLLGGFLGYSVGHEITLRRRRVITLAGRPQHRRTPVTAEPLAQARNDHRAPDSQVQIVFRAPRSDSHDDLPKSVPMGVLVCENTKHYVESQPVEDLSAGERSSEYREQQLLLEYKLIPQGRRVQESITHTLAKASQQYRQQNEEQKKSTSKYKRFQQLETAYRTEGRLTPPDHGVTVYGCRTQYLPGIGFATCQGNRPDNEDIMSAGQLEISLNQTALTVPFFAIYDGHRSITCAMAVADTLPRRLQQRLAFYNPDGLTVTGCYNALTSAFTDTNIEIKNAGAGYRSGTTAAICLLFNNKLMCASAGDSRIALVSPGGTVQQMSADATLHDKEFQESVRKRGGEIIYVSSVPRIGGEVAVPVCFGHTGEPGFTARPGISCAENTATPPFKDWTLLLFTDGVYQCATTEQLGKAAWNIRQLNHDAQQAAAVLVAATQQANHDLTSLPNAVDNKSVVVAYL